MKPYYEVSHTKLFNKDCRNMSELPDESVDLLVTDPPYQLSTIDRFKKPDSGEKWNVKSGVYHRIDKGFMGQEWDVLPPVEVWRESLRVLKPGAFAFIMTTPRQDSLCQILSDLTNAGFQMSFSSIYWTYSSGFPKAQNIGKAVDKRLGAEREVVGTEKVDIGMQSGSMHAGTTINVIEREKTIATSPQAKALEGSYGGFQPKPAVEVIIVAMKPLSEKTFVDQALKNRKGITWLDGGMIPYESEVDKEGARFGTQMDIRGGNLKTPKGIKAKNVLSSQSGRFPANLLVSDDALNDGVSHSGGSFPEERGETAFFGLNKAHSHRVGKMGDSGSFSRYFDLDKWWAKTFPFLIVPKASKSEKNRGLEDISELPRKLWGGAEGHKGVGDYKPDGSPRADTRHKNIHPTVKPLKLMSYLITLGSREGDTVLDNFAGSGTTAVAALLLGRRCIMYEIKEQYCEIAKSRLTYYCQEAMNL